MADNKFVEPEAAISLGVEFNKRDDDRQLVFGFAKFAEDPTNRGHLLVDRQDDIITPTDLEDSAYEYVLTSRDSGEMHVTKGAATLVESFMVTPEKLEAMGLPGDSVPQGWWVGYKVHNDEAWARIKDGTYQGFSVEGFGIREEVELLDDEPEHSEDVAKSHDEWSWMDEGITEPEIRERRQLILDLFRESRITDSERDQLLRGLPAPEEFKELVAQQRAERESASILARIRRAMGLEDGSAQDD